MRDRRRLSLTDGARHHVAAAPFGPAPATHVKVARMHGRSDVHRLGERSRLLAAPMSHDSHAGVPDNQALHGPRSSADRARAF